MIKVTITWPTALLILAAIMLWLLRPPDVPAQPVPARERTPRPTARPERTPRRFARPAEPGEPIIIDQRATTRRDGADRAESPDLEAVSYADAIRAPHGTYSPEEIDAIAQRELREAAHDGFNQASSSNPFNRTPGWRTQ